MVMITVETAEALQLLLQAHRMASSIRPLHIQAARGMPRITLPTDLGSDMSRLNQVCVSHSDSFEEVVVVYDERWSSYLSYVNFLHLKALSNAKIVLKLVPSGCTRSGLSIVEIIDCPKVEELIPGEVADEARADGRRILPVLQTLNLVKLSELKSIYRFALSFPSLRCMMVEDCPQLKRLPFGDQSCRSLEEIQGQQWWWDALVWDDDPARARILPSSLDPFVAIATAYTPTTELTAIRAL